MGTTNYHNALTDPATLVDLNTELASLDEAIGDVPGLIPGGRLTLSSGAPEATNISGAGTLYYTPYKSNKIALYNGATWKLLTFSEISSTLSTLLADTVYDVFAYDSSGSVALEYVAWTNDTTRATALAYHDGVRVKSGDNTRRFIGIIRTDASKQLTANSTTLQVANQNNRIALSMEAGLIDNHTYSGSYRLWTGGTTSGNVTLNILMLPDLLYSALVFGTYRSSSGDSVRLGTGIDNVLALSNALTQSTMVISGHPNTFFTGLNGYRNVRVLEQADGAGGTFFEATLEIGAFF